MTDLLGEDVTGQKYQKYKNKKNKNQGSLSVREMTLVQKILNLVRQKYTDSEEKLGSGKNETKCSERSEILQNTNGDLERLLDETIIEL